MKSLFLICLRRRVATCCHSRWLQRRTLCSNVESLRNIGVVAHIDAGKTTFTERALHEAGTIDTFGKVDAGSTVTDYLIEERRRGITIIASLASFRWRSGFKVNIVDTPGHADFVAEVERSLAVVDGCIVLVDALVGVQAQTKAVWRLATKFSHPMILVMNKMDRLLSVKINQKKLIEEKFALLRAQLRRNRLVPEDTQLLLCQTVVTNGSRPSEDLLIDFLSRTIEICNGESNGMISFDDIDELLSSEQCEIVKAAYLNFIQQLAEVDDDVATLMLETLESDVTGKPLQYVLELYDKQLVMSALAKSMASGNAIPVFFCSALKGGVGVSTVIDNAVRLLPSPRSNVDKVGAALLASDCETKPMFSCVGVAYKHLLDRHHGRVALCKLLTGSLNSKSNVKAVTITADSKQSEHEFDVQFSKPQLIKGVFDVLGNQLLPITGSTTPGDIVAVALAGGSLSVGQTFVVGGRAGTSAQNNAMRRLLADGADRRRTADAQATRRAPIVYCAVEAACPRTARRMEAALAEMADEDGGLKVVVGSAEASKQTVIGGQGELHLEVVKNRLLQEYGFEADDVRLGEMMITQYETVTAPTTAEFSCSKTLPSGKTLELTCKLMVEPISVKSYHEPEIVNLKLDAGVVRMNPHGQNSPSDAPVPVTGVLLSSARRALASSWRMAAGAGPLRRRPVIACRPRVVDVVLCTVWPNDPGTMMALSAAVKDSWREVIAGAQPTLLEPAMAVSLTCGEDARATVERALAKRMASDITEETDAGESSGEFGMIDISCTLPLRQLSGFNVELKTLSKGSAFLNNVSLHDYTPCIPE